MPNAVHLHRVLATRPDKVYRAFLEPDALAKWLPPNGYTCTVHRLEATPGGGYRMSFRNFTTGQAILSAANTSSWSHMNGCAIRTDSKTQT